MARRAAITIIIGLTAEVDEKLFLQAVEKMLHMCEQNPTTTATMELALSVIFIADSMNDYGKIEIYRKQIINAFKHKDEDVRLESLKLIKESVLADQDRQSIMGVIKGICTAAFDYVAASTANPWLLWSMGGAASLSGAATLMNAYNYQQCSILLSKLKQNGHLD